MVLFIMEIAYAVENDIERVMSLIKECIRDMESHGIHQWGEYYPTREIIQDDIENRSLYTAKEDDEVLGIIAVNEEQPPEWERVNWTPQEGRILALHRLAVKPTRQKQGIARRLLDYAEDYAADNRYTAIRLDAYSGNPRALRLYEKNQYKRVGEIRFPGRDLPFYCYEKILSEQRYQRESPRVYYDVADSKLRRTN
jgi:ribosomal protein S18 acetylase RimI-like enzyme